MICCPGIRCKNTGSGYVKSDNGSETARELDKRMEEMLKARDAQDTHMISAFKVVGAAIPVENKSIVERAPTNSVTTVSKR